MRISTLPVLTEDNLPNWAELEKTAYEKDKTCVVCGKPKMNLNRYQTHMAFEHDVALDKEEPNIDDYEEARYIWLNLRETYEINKDERLNKYSSHKL